MVMLEIVAVPAFADNYLWLVHDADSGETAVVDPGDAAPVLAEAERRGWTISQIWNTHWHPDHTGGNLAVKDATGARDLRPGEREDSGPRCRIVRRRHDPASASMPGESSPFPAIRSAISPHLRGGAAWLSSATPCSRWAAAGCSKARRNRCIASLGGLRRLPDDMRLYCAHEYTLSNARFAAHAEPGNAAIAGRLARSRAMRERGEITRADHGRAERETNPFVRSSDWQEFARLRSAKDSFRS